MHRRPARTRLLIVGGPDDVDTACQDDTVTDRLMLLDSASLYLLNCPFFANRSISGD